MLFVTELLQSLGNRHANERKPRPNRSEQSKIGLPSHTASAWQAIGDSGDAERYARTRTSMLCATQFEIHRSPARRPIVLRVIWRIVLSLNQLRGLTHAAFPWPTRDDLEL